MQKFNDSRDWFFERRYGLFIHWGIYAVGGRHEQEIYRFGTSWEQYYNYMKEFNPTAYSPTEWLDMAEDGGMEYMVFTAKHHDGFCMWDTAETDFKVTNTPYGKDILAELAAECHRRKFPLVIYYSAVDWHHPQYPNVGRHHEITTDPSHHDMDGYMKFLKKQIRELCSNYGEIHGFWWDMNVPELHDPEVNAIIRELQPGAVINNRGFDGGDFSTPERTAGATAFTPFSKPTEACNSIGVNSWGYRSDEDYFSIMTLEKQIAEYLALGANFLLNAGPGPDGRFTPDAKRIIHTLGQWYKNVKPGLTANPRYTGSAEMPATGSDHELNLIMLAPPNSATIALPALSVEKAVLLNTGRELTLTSEPIVYKRAEGPVIRVRNFPVDEMAGQVAVIKLYGDFRILQSPADKLPDGGKVIL